MPHPKRRHSKARTHSRRAHDFLKLKSLTVAFPRRSFPLPLKVKRHWYWSTPSSIDSPTPAAASGARSAGARGLDRPAATCRRRAASSSLARGRRLMGPHP